MAGNRDLIDELSVDCYRQLLGITSTGDCLMVDPDVWSHFDRRTGVDDHIERAVRRACREKFGVYDPTVPWQKGYAREVRRVLGG